MCKKKFGRNNQTLCKGNRQSNQEQALGGNQPNDLTFQCDPTRIDPQVAQKNLVKLMELIRKFLEHFFDSWPLFPMEFEALLKIFYTSLTEVTFFFTNSLQRPKAQRKCILVWVTLRKPSHYLEDFYSYDLFALPLCLPTNTKLWLVSRPFQSLTLSEELSTQAQRALILTSKILQSIGNQMEFEEKENFLIGANDFVRDHMSKMYAFVSTLMVTGMRKPNISG
jgi:hypothetical protein